MERRTFLKHSICLLSIPFSSLTLPSCGQLTPKKASRKLAFFSVDLNQINEKYQRHGFKVNGGEGNQLHLLDMDQYSIESIPIPVSYPHSIIQSQNNPDLAVITPRDFNTAAIIDLKRKRILSTLQLKNGEQFYGHGFFAHNGESFYLSGYEKSKKGFLRKFNLLGQAIQNQETYGNSPHDTALIGDGRVALIANNGWSGSDTLKNHYDSNMAFIDVSTGLLIESVTNSNSAVTFQHFVANEQGDFVVGCDLVARKGPSHLEENSLLGLRRMNKELVFLASSPEFNRKISGNILSLAWNEKAQTVLTTTPEGVLTKWDLKQMKAVEQSFLDAHPQGVVASDESFLVTTTNSGIWEYDLQQKSRLINNGISNIHSHASWILS